MGGELIEEWLMDNGDDVAEENKDDKTMKGVMGSGN